MSGDKAQELANAVEFVFIDDTSDGASSSDPATRPRGADDHGVVQARKRIENALTAHRHLAYIQGANPRACGEMMDSLDATMKVLDALDNDLWGGL